tara:strand:+ start:1352 stop:1624 length:273 start_codon:yes stop_codon:yes gene_type:complete
MNIKKELIESLASKMESNPQIYAEQLLTLRYRFSDLASNYDWLQAECEMHRNSYEGMDASHRAELRERYDETQDEYYENLKQLKAKYLES